MTSRACWRLDHDGLHDVEVDLRPSATMGELAHALVAHVASLPGSVTTVEPWPDETEDATTVCVDGRPIDPRRLAIDAAPPSGSTIQIQRLTDNDARPPDRSTLAPVALLTAAGLQNLRYGRTQVTDGVIVHVGRQVIVHDDGFDTITVDGAPVHGHSGLGDGAMLRCGTWTATLAIRGVLRPPPRGGPAAPQPIARGEWHDHEPVVLQLPPTPGRYRPPGFPWLSAAVPLLMTAGMWIATRSVMMVAFMGFSVVYVVASGIEGRREARAADRFLVTEFREELAGISGELEQSRDEQRHRDEMHSPCVQETIAWTRPISHRLWERSGLHPHPTVVRLGLALAAPDDTVLGDCKGRPSLRREVDDVLSHNETRPRPASIELAATGGVAIIGDHHLTLPLAAALVAQLVTLAPPDRVGIDLHVGPAGWEWTHWLPHLNHRGQQLVTVVDRDRIDDFGDSDRPVIWLAPDAAGVPDGIRALVHFDSDGLATLQVDHGTPREFEPETIGPAVLETTARRLAGLRPGAADGDDTLPTGVDLTGIGLGLATSDVLEQWATPRSGLPVPIGRVRGGGVLTVDLTVDGPHSLVAGTTGAGKSELLRTMLAGLAYLHPPDRVTMLLVDYKGGAAFGPLAGLPHCVGLVTDLGPAEVVRTLAALRAELKRREQLLDDHRAGDLTELDTESRPPALLVVVDEFATLVSEVPDFLDGVLDVAQRGRSLGIHMVLATQRPTGVISDAVRANTSLRIALRLPDAEDSVDVIDSPDASTLPRDVPGRAVIRLGHDTLVSTQIAFSGHPARPLEELEIRSLGSPPSRCEVDHDGPTQLAALVAATNEAVAHLGLASPPAPLPPPLPEHLDLTAVVEAGANRCGAEDPWAPLQIGVVDLPHLQRRDVLAVDPARRGGVIVIGAPTSGASTTLVTIAAAVERRGGWDIHAIDNDGGLSGLTGMASVRSVMGGGDHEAVTRLLGRLTEGPVERPTLLLLDGFGAFEERQSRVNRGRATELLTRLAEEGRVRGVIVAMTARRRNEVPPALLHSMGERIALRSVDEDQAAMMDAPPRLAARDLPPGRTWFGGQWGQIAVTDDAPGIDPLPAAPVLPTSLSLSSLAAPRRASLWDLALGMGADELGPAHLDLSRGGALVAGQPGSGRTSALATVRAAAQRNGISTVEDLSPAEVLGRLVDSARSGDLTPRLGLVDDLDRWMDDSEVDDLLCEVTHLARSEPVRVVAAGDPIHLRRSYADGVQRLRSSRTGILLGSGAHEWGELLHHELHRRDDIAAAAGRGWLVSESGAEIVQLGQP